MEQNVSADVSLWQALRAGDTEARGRLIEENMQLVFWLAGRYRGRGTEWEDLCQAGAIGLMKAVDNFCPEYNCKFSTYAVPMIMGELRRAVSSNSLLHISRSYREKQIRVAEANRRLTAKLGREPALGELAEFLEMSAQELAEVLAAAQKPLSLQGGAEDEPSPQEMVAVEDGEAGWTERLALNEAMARLPSRLAYILRARYLREETQVHIAAGLGISQVQVSRLEKQALQKLKNYLL